MTPTPMLSNLPAILVSVLLSDMSMFAGCDLLSILVAIDAHHLQESCPVGIVDVADLLS